MFSKSPGFSVVEVMLAAFLGLLLMSGLIEVYLSVKTVYPLQEALARMQENGRFATYFLNQAVHEAGYVDCKDATGPGQPQEALIGYSARNLPGEWKRKVVGASDMLLVKKCTVINDVEQVVAVAFFIGDTGRLNQKNKPVYALYQKIGDQSQMELVPGVENMHIKYGVSDETGLNVARYALADQLSATDWAKVRGVHITFLLNSIDDITPKSESYRFDGNIVPAQNRLLHREWQTYIALREARQQ